MWGGRRVAHYWGGALVIALLVILVAPGICNFLLRLWNKEVMHHKLPWLQESLPVSKVAVIVGALIGTLSHILLDSLMHHDIRPFSPISDANPFLELMTHDGVYQLCAILGVLGAIAWLGMNWINRDQINHE